MDDTVLVEDSLVGLDATIAAVPVDVLLTGEPVAFETRSTTAVDAAHSHSPVQQQTIVAPQSISTHEMLVTLSRKFSRRRKPLHTAGLQHAMDDMASVLGELRDLDAKELARMKSEDDEGSSVNDHDKDGKQSRSDNADGMVEVVSSSSSSSSSASEESDGSPSSAAHSGTSIDDLTGRLMQYKAEVLHEYNDEFPPLRTLRMRSNEAKQKRDAETRQSASISLLGTSQWRHSKELEPSLLSQKDQRRVDLLKRRDWIEIPDDAHEQHCLMNGLDPWASTSRKPKTHRWFDNRPMYSPAVLLLAQVSQQQVSAIRKKHGRKGDKNNIDALLPDGASPGGKAGSLSLDPPLQDVHHPMPRLANAYFDNSIFPMCYNNAVTPKEVEQLIVEGEAMMKGVAEKLQSFVSFRGLRRRLSQEDGDDQSFAIGMVAGGSGNATEMATEMLLVKNRVCAVVSATDASLAFIVFPNAAALPLFRPKRAPSMGDSLNASLNPLSRFASSSFRGDDGRGLRKAPTNYTTSWVQQWQQYLAAEEKRYASPRAAAAMYQELARIHPSGGDCRMWVVKRLIRWIMKAKRSLLRYTLLRCRLVYSIRKPRAECASLIIPYDFAMEQQELLEQQRMLTDEAPDNVAADGDSGDVAVLGQSVVMPPEDSTREVTIDPLPLQDSGGLVLVRSSARRELMYNEILPLPPKPQEGETLTDDAREDLRKGLQERIGAEVVMNVVVAPTFDPISRRDDDAAVADDAGGDNVTRTEATDSLVEDITNLFCEVMINLESTLRQRRETYDELAAELYKEITDAQMENNGVLQARKKRQGPRNDGVQLGLIKSAATAEAQEKMNPLNGAIQLALRAFHEYVVQHVLSNRPPSHDGQRDSPQLSPTTSSAPKSQGKRSPGLVSLREVVARAFRDDHHLTPDWSATSEPRSKGASKKSRSSIKSNTDSIAPSHANSSHTAGSGNEEDDVEEDSEAAALRTFLKPMFTVDQTFCGNIKAQRLPNRLFHPQQMDFLENLHTYDDASIFNLRRRERCCSSAEVVEDVTEMFQRLVELINSIDTAAIGDDDPFAPNASTTMSNAMSQRNRARKKNKMGNSVSMSIGPGGEAAVPLIPRKQFGTVMRVMIDRMVRRLLVNVCQLLRSMTTDGRASSTPALEAANRFMGGTIPQLQTVSGGHGLSKEASGAHSDTMSSVATSSQKRGSLGMSVSLHSRPDEPTFSKFSETAAAANGNHPQHQLTEFLQGWTWLAHHATCTQLIWGPGKDFETDKDRLHDKMVQELRSIQMPVFTAFGGSDATSTSVLQRFGDSLDANLSITAPIAVAECIPLTEDDVTGLCSMFPTVKHIPSRLAALQHTTKEQKAAKRKSVVGGIGSVDFGSIIGGVSLNSAGDTSAGAKREQLPELTNYVGEEQFLFTILHILDICTLTIDAVPAIGIDAAAHLRNGGTRSNGKTQKKGPKGRAAPKSKFLGTKLSVNTNSNALDIRDTLFFRWRFHIKIRLEDLATDVRHCTLTLFEKSVSRDLLITSLLALKSALRRLHLGEEEILKLQSLEAQRKQDEEEAARKKANPDGDDYALLARPALTGVIAAPIPKSITSINIIQDDDEPTDAERTAADGLRRRAVQKRLGIEMNSERQLLINAVLSRLNIVVQAITKEDRILMKGVRSLLEDAPPTQRDCFALLQQTFLREFEKWDSYRSSAAAPEAPALTPSASLRSTSEFAPTPTIGLAESSGGGFQRSMMLDGSAATPSGLHQSSTFLNPLEHQSPHLRGGSMMMKSPRAGGSTNSLRIAIPEDPNNSVTAMPSPKRAGGGARTPSIVPPTPSSGSPVNGSSQGQTLFTLRCEKCHHRPKSILYRHKDQQRKRVVALTQEELDLMFGGDDGGVPSGPATPRRSRLGSRMPSVDGAPVSSLPIQHRRSTGAGGTIGGGFIGVPSNTSGSNAMRKNLTKIVTESCDVFVCDSCFPAYIAQYLIRRLIDAMHAAQAAEAADAAAQAAAMADKIRKQMRKELFGAHLIPEDATTELFEQVQEAVKKREKDRQKKNAASAHSSGGDSGSESSSDKPSSSDDDQKGGNHLKQRSKKHHTKKKTKKHHGGDDDDDEFSALSAGPKKGHKGGKGGGKKRNFLEEKLASVMVGVQQEQLILHEHSERLEVKRVALADRNKLRVDLARLLYIYQHGCEPESLEDLIRDQSLVLDVASDDDAEAAEKRKHMEEQQAEADRLMNIARQQSQSKIGSFKRAASMVRKPSVKFIPDSPNGSIPMVESMDFAAGGGIATEESVYLAALDDGSLDLSATFEANDVTDEFGLPLLRSVSGLTIAQLEAQIAAVEGDLSDNRLMMLKKDLEERLEMLTRAKEELARLQEKFAERKRRHEEARRLHREAKAAKAGTEVKAKKAAGLRKAAAKFLNAISNTSSPSSGPNSARNGSTPRPAIAEMTDEEIIQMAEDSKKQQDEMSSRLMRGEGRRATDRKNNVENLFDDDDDDGRTESPAVKFVVNGGDVSPAPPPPDYDSVWDSVVGQGRNTLAKTSGALRQLCMQKLDATSLTPVTLLPQPNSDDDDEARVGSDGDSSPDQGSVAQSPAAGSLSSTPPPKAAKKSLRTMKRRKGKGAKSSSPSTSKTDTHQLTSSSSSPYHIPLLQGVQWDEEWFTVKGESDEPCSKRDDGLLIMSYMNRLDPLPWCLSSASSSSSAHDPHLHGRQLREALLQSAFVQEAVCVLLDMSCGLVRRAGDHSHDEHLDGLVVGHGGVMLELFGFAHPLEDEINQAIGAPTNAAAVARALKAIQEHARGQHAQAASSSGAKQQQGGAAFSPLRSVPRRFAAEQLFGEPQRKVTKYCRTFFARLQNLKRKAARLKPFLTVYQGQQAASARTRSDSVFNIDASPSQPLTNAATSALTPVSQLIQLGNSVDESPLDSSPPPAAAKRQLNSPEGDDDGAGGNSFLASAVSDEDPDSSQLMHHRISPWGSIAGMREDGIGTIGADVDAAKRVEPRRQEKPNRFSREEADSSEEDNNTEANRVVKAELLGVPRNTEGEVRSALQPWSMVKSHGFREKLKQETELAASEKQSTLKAAEDSKVLGCLAEVVLPGIEILAPDAMNVHASVTQAWWQLRLVVVALLRFYTARSFLSYRTLWLYSRRLTLKRVLAMHQAAILAAQEQQAAAPGDESRSSGRVAPCSRSDILLHLFSKPYVVEKVYPVPQRPQRFAVEQSEGDASSVDNATTDDGSQTPHAPSTAASSVAEATLVPPTAAGGDVTPSLLGTSSVVTSESGDDNADDDGSAHLPLTPPKPVITRKYLKPKVLQGDQEKLQQSVLTLYHSHVALAHNAVEEYAAGYLRVFSTLPGGPAAPAVAAQLQPRDCLRMTDCDVVERVQYCILQRASAMPIDHITGKPSAESVKQFIADVGRMALAMFILGPAVEARSTLTLLGVEAIDVALHMVSSSSRSQPPTQPELRFTKGTSYADCVDAVNFLEQLMFPSQGTSVEDDEDSDDDNEEDTVKADQPPPEVEPSNAEVREATPVRDSRPLIEAILVSSPGESITGWNGGGDEGSAAVVQRAMTASSAASTTDELIPEFVPQAKPAKPLKPKKTRYELSALHRRILAVVDSVLFESPALASPRPPPVGETPAQTPPQKRRNDAGLLSAAMDNAAYAALYGAPTSSLVSMGIQACLHFLSGGSLAAAGHRLWNPPPSQPPHAAGKRDAFSTPPPAKALTLDHTTATGDEDGATVVVHGCRLLVPMRTLSDPTAAIAKPTTVETAQIAASGMALQITIEHLRAGVAAMMAAAHPPSRHAPPVGAKQSDNTKAAGGRRSQSQRHRVALKNGPTGTPSTASMAPQSRGQRGTPSQSPDTSHAAPFTGHRSPPPQEGIAPVDPWEHMPSILECALGILVGFAERQSQAEPQRAHVYLLPLPIGDVFGGSASTLHRAMTEQHPVAQLRTLEELRKRQKKFSEQLFAMLTSAAPQEAKSLFASIGAEHAYSGSGGLHELLNKTMSDTLGIDSNWSLDDYARASMSRNPLDVLRNARLSRMSLTDAVAQHLRDHFHNDEDLGGTKSSMLAASLSSPTGEPDHQGGNSALVGQASSPFLSRNQRGSMFMEKLLQRRAQQPDQLEASVVSGRTPSPRIGDNELELFRPDGVIHTEHLNLTKNVSTLHHSILSHTSGDSKGADIRQSTQSRRLSVKINHSLGDSLPLSRGDNGWDQRVSIAAAFDELKQVHKARLQWVRKTADGKHSDEKTPNISPRRHAEQQPPRVSLKNMSLFDDMEFFEESEVEEKERAFAFSIRASAAPSNNEAKELTEQDVKRFHKNRRKSKDMALIDATGLISNPEKQPNEFFVPLMTVATQLLEFSDRTRTDLHWQVPPQWVEDSETFMVIRLDRPRPEHRKVSGQSSGSPTTAATGKGLEPVVHAAFLYDPFREITEELEGNVGALFSSYHPGNAWVPPQPQPACPWVECKVTRRKGIVMLESPLGSYRVSERVLKILVRSADPPRIHVPRDSDSTALDAFMFDATDDSAGSSVSVTPRGGRGPPQLPEPQDISSMVDDAALSAIIYRKAMLRRFFMPCTTTEGGRRSYTSKQPFDPDRALLEAMNDHHVDYQRLIQLIPHDQPQGLAHLLPEHAGEIRSNMDGVAGDTALSSATTPDGVASSWTNMDFLSYDRMFKEFHRSMLRTSKQSVMEPRLPLLSPPSIARTQVPTNTEALLESPSPLQRQRQHRPHHVKFLPPMDEAGGAGASPAADMASSVAPEPLESVLLSTSPTRRGTLAPSPSKVIMRARRSLQQEGSMDGRSSTPTPLTSVEETILRMSNSAVVASNRLPPLLSGPSGSHSASASLGASSATLHPNSTRIVSKWSQLLPKATTTAKKT